ncbi:MAG TPA: hypothetical protein ENN28_00335 [Candidatus Uhrbacteria bacterium]|nr:hypothetical protein [Candidatus Uhrbacteria bacterium]
MRFFIKYFPEIKHFVFNNLDPEMIKFNAGFALIPKLVDFKMSLNRALGVLQKNNKTFRVERVPLCYMSEFAEYSTETRKIVKKEERPILFLDKRNKNGIDFQKNFFYSKLSICQKCSLNQICAGLYSKYYLKAKELIPQKIDNFAVINKIKAKG